MTYMQLKNIYKVYDDKVLAIDNFNLSIDKHEFIVLIGPSGCGKSTVLRMIAGLEDITYGDLYIKGNRINTVHAKDRNMSMVFQNYALYPHLNIYENISFGLELRKEKKSIINQKTNETANLLGLEKLLDRTPSELSGGQRQRVALGRAIVQSAEVFLMDEPLSNLDAKLRNKMRSEIINLHNKLNTTTIYVTHDQVEAMTMADRIVVMNDGKIEQIGTPYELYYNPNNLFVAQFIGDPEINIFKGKVDSQGSKLFIGNMILNINKEKFNKINDYVNKEVIIGIRSENIKIFTDNVVDKALHQTEVNMVEMRGDISIIYANLAENTLTIKASSTDHIKVNQTIYFKISTNHLFLFDKESGDRI